MMQLKGLLSEKSFFVQLIAIILIVVFMYCFSNVLCVLILKLMGLSLDAMDSNLYVLCFMQSLITIFSFLFSALLAAYLIDKEPSKLLRINHIPPFSQIVISLFALFFLYPITAIFADMNAHFVFPESLKALEDVLKSLEDGAMEATTFLLSAKGTVNRLMIVVVVAVLPAICEEILFRGLIIPFFKKKMNIHLAIFLSAFIFSAFHFQFYGLLPRFILGVILGYTFYFTDSLLTSITLHFCNNFMSISAFWLSGGMIEESPQMESMALNTSFYFIAMFMGVVGVLLITTLIRKRHKKIATLKANSTSEQQLID